jgi:serine/threonine protein kinase
MVGVTLAGRYVLEARLARGGMASVYLARHTLIGRHVAIKLLRRDLCHDPVQRDRFLREARACNRIDHENIVQITDFGEGDDGRIFLVMEYLPGESLHHRIGRGILSPSRALDIAGQIAAGLARAHQTGVIHRDLKPDNILLLPPSEPGGRDRVKVLDFGIAKLLDQPALTAADKIFGTPGYIAPEYAAGSALDARADLYSLGVVLYEMVTGRLPFEAASPAELLVKHMLHPPIPPRTFQPDLPDELERFILRLLVKNPDQRFRDAFHLLEELERVRPALETARVERPSLRVRAPTPVDLRGPTSREQPALADVNAPSPEQGRSAEANVAWGRYIDSLRGALAERHRGDVPPDTLERVAAMESLVAQVEAKLVRADELRGSMTALEARGRDLRRTIGRAVDALSKDLSARARERDDLALERQSIERERQAQLDAQAHGHREAAGAADALLWRLAACDEMLRDSVAACEDLEFQVRSLEGQLARSNEGLERERDALLSMLEATVDSLGQDDGSLRDLATVLAAEG